MNQIDAGKVGKLQAIAWLIVATGVAASSVIFAIAQLVKG